MLKKTLGLVALVGMLAMALPVLAVTTTSTTTAANAAKVACVGAAVNAREQALDSGINAYQQAVNTAYTARAAALQQAYSQTPGNGVIAKAIKAAWSDFNKAIKAASKTWKTTKNGAWTKFRAADKACKAPTVSTDTSNASTEVVGQ